MERAGPRAALVCQCQPHDEEPVGRANALRVEQDHPREPSQTLIARIFAISRVDQVVLVLVGADMVVKPGA